MQICIFISFTKPIARYSKIFANNFELNIDTATASNTFLTVVLSDFNTKSNLWSEGDKTTYEGSKIDGLPLHLDYNK